MFLCYEKICPKLITLSSDVKTSVILYVIVQYILHLCDRLHSYVATIFSLQLLLYIHVFLLLLFLLTDPKRKETTTNTQGVPTDDGESKFQNIEPE